MPMNDKELDELFRKGKDSLQSHFAEIRSNILLDIGFQHPRYDRWGNTRSTIFKDGAKQKKIRVTKNHTQVITKFYRNAIQNRAPDGGIFPQNEKELCDIKAAQLNASVYDWMKVNGKLIDFYAKQIHDFVVPGECHAKIFFDPRGGKFQGYGKDGQPIFRPGFIFERIPPYNMVTDPDADSEATCMWKAIEKFIPRKRLMQRYAGQGEKTLMIEQSSAEDVDWFQGFTGISGDTSDLISVREIYFKESEDDPRGRYYYTVEKGILEEGELPDGFPIFSRVFDESPDNPRGYSVVKVLKSYQAEINRCAAAVITESIVLGHSTVLYQHGSKLTTSSIGNGLKGLSYQGGQPPVVIPGRNGDQYIEYMNQQVEEMYRVAMVPQIDEEKITAGQNDAYAMLFRSLRDKMRFSIYGEKIEAHICDMIEYALKLARRYMPDDEVIPVIGKSEAVNIAEFRKTRPANYYIKVKPRSDDFSSTLGKTIQISQLLQYAGSQLPPEALAALAQEMPFLSDKSVLPDWTTKKDQMDAVILALDRGEQPFFFERTDHAYAINRLETRMNENDFPLHSQEIQLNYLDRLSMHEEVMTRQEQEAAAATSGFIPASGGLISVDYYIVDEKGTQKRARLPYEAVDWLVKRLAQQGTQVEKLTNLPMAAQADIGQMMNPPMNPMNPSQGMGMEQGLPQGPIPMTGS